jgi:hypothetical protein
MTVCGRACAKIRMGGVSGRFNEAAKHDRCENAMCVLDSTNAGRFPGLQIIAAACADLCVALSEADTFHLSSLWKGRSAWPKSREIIAPNGIPYRVREHWGQTRGRNSALLSVPPRPMLLPPSTRYHATFAQGPAVTK